MYERVEKPKGNRNRVADISVFQKKSNAKKGIGLLDSRPEAVAQRKLQELSNDSQQVSQLKAFQEVTSIKTQSNQNIYLQNGLTGDDEVTQLAHYSSGGPEYMVDNDPTSELIDDNFDDTIKDQLNQPTADGTVEKAVQEGKNIEVILWRSTTGASVAAIQSANSAGGAAAQENVAAPGHEVQQNQIAVGGVVPEYTASQSVTGFSFKHWLVVVKINTKYLARGSGSESGWICSSAAPVKVLDTVDRTLGLPEPKGLGAA
ncbi:MAG: DUF4765 family protein [Cyanobacteria bacterium P01_E01_bin.6]